jgi:hypothetical protein
MTTAVTLFNSAGLPAHLADLGGEEGNIVGRETIPQLSYRGKVWRVVIDGEETIATKEDGEPMQVIPVVILEYNKKRSRAYFPGGYEDGKTGRPACASKDSVTPDANVQDKQAETCASCPMAVKGSKVTEAGKETTACSPFKNAVVVAPTLSSGWKPLLLKMAQTSIWDKDAAEYEAKGFYAFDNYMDMLKRMGCNHTARVVTKIKFDPRVAYPKLFFGPADWLPADVVEQVKELLGDKDNLGRLLNIDLSTETLGVDTSKATETPTPTTAKSPAAKPPAAPKAPAAPKPPATPPPAAVVVDPDENVSISLTKPTPAAVAKAKVTAIDATPVARVPADAIKGAGLSTLLNAWDDTP